MEEIVIDDPPTAESFHEPTSIYFGLPLSKQLALSRFRRGFRKTPKAVTKHFHKANDHDYALLLNHCVTALIQQSEYEAEVRLDRIKIRLKLPFNYRSHYGKRGGDRFPRPSRFLAYFDWHTLVEYNVDVIINYLHSIGKSAFTAKELRKFTWAVKAEQDRLDFLSDYSIPLCTAELYNEVVPRARDKNLKGRRNYRKSGLHKKPKPSEDSSEEMLDKAVEGDV